MFFPPLTAHFTEDSLLETGSQQLLQQFWQSGTSNLFSGVDACPIHYRYWQPANATAVLIVLPGRIEAGHKYLEFCYDAVQSGYQVYVLDHRGQGESGRLCADQQIGLVWQFEHYVQDLQQWLMLIEQQTTLPKLAVAHSMGGGILARFCQRMAAEAVTSFEPEPGSGDAVRLDILLQAVVFLSPMWGIRSGPLSSRLALRLAQTISQCNLRLSKNIWYGPGQQAYRDLPFADNDLTLSQPRYQLFRQLYQQYPQYQLGGVSWHWLAQALQACQHIQQGPKLTLPGLLIQAAADTVVDNQQQAKIWQNWQPELQKKSVGSARHELLFAPDAQRQQVFSAINQFLSSVNEKDIRG